MRSNRLRWLALGAAALGFVGAGLSRISFDVEILKLLPRRLPQVEGLSLFLEHFSLPNELIITLEAADADTAEAAADSLGAHLASSAHLVKRVVSRPPWESKPGELSEFLAFLVLNQAPEKIDALLARLAPENAAATAQSTLDQLNESVSAQEIAMRSYDPFDLAGPLAEAGLMSGAQQSEFSSPDGVFRVLYVETAQPFANYKAAISWLRQIKALAAEWNGARGLKLGFTGEPAFIADISGSMEWDMMSSGFITLLVIAIIFFVCYRRLRPLLELQAMLVLIFTLSLATAGLFLNQLTVIGVGCAAIMVGLSVDYGYFVYQRSQRNRGSVRELQRQCVQNIAWTSGTTAAAFFALNFSSLPGLSQLGNLVGIGVVIGALVMLGIFAPLAARFRDRKGEAPPTILERLFASPRFTRAAAWVTLALVAALVIVLAVKGLPAADFSARSLRPRASEAYRALDRLRSRLTDDRDFLSLVARGANEDEVLARLRMAEDKLAAAKARGEVESFRSALALWPDAASQRANLPRLAPLAAEIPRLRQTLFDAGFTEETFALTESVLTHWAAWAAQTPPLWPANEMSRWIFRRVVSRGEGEYLALGMVQPAAGREEALSAAVESPGVHLVSWNQLGAELKRVIPREFVHVIIGLLAVVLALLALAFRSWRVLALFIGTTALVLVCLAGAMSLFGMSWNFFNLAAVMLLLGTGTDYSILLLLALKRNGGDVPAAHRELGLVIFLCASSAASGFGTISWANNLGLASLGQTCAIGLVLDALISLFLLPRAWTLFHRRRLTAR